MAWAYIVILLYFLHFDLSEIIAFDRYLPVTPALPVTSETCPLPLDYSTWIGKEERFSHFLAGTQNLIPGPRL